ncbi:MAG: aspartate aminotransferase family protein [Gammaproteobacteria bacterium]|nr:aspartate aminotransferase family protein [Gammaproteobacteria bacterium]
MTNSLMTTYNRLAVNFTHGKGASLFDSNGDEYLDALTGIAVCGLGHSHPAITAAICEQAEKLLHTSNLYGIDLQQQLADKLTALSGMDAVFFGNSGAEANEAAIKLARLHGHHKGIEKPTIIVMEDSFHGRTMATLSATGNRKVQAGFEPLVQGFVRVPYNDVDAVRAVAENNHDIVAILVEPIQGESGVNIPADDYLNQLRAICDEHDWLLMLDEIQTGMGRTGEWFAFQHYGIQPDVMTLAKALGNGVPIGACLAQGKAASTFAPGNHGSTFGGNPLSCRAALAVINTIEQDNLLENTRNMGQYLLDGFRDKLQGVEGVSDIRAKGLMLAIELEHDCAELVQRALEQKLLINVAGGNRIRLLPPLIIDKPQADQIIEIVSGLVTAFLSENTN